MQSKQPQSIFPDLPRESPIVDNQGNINKTWSLGFAQLFQALQMNFKNEGIVLPALDATQISSIQTYYAQFIGNPLQLNNQPVPDISGQTIFDSTTRVPKVFIITFDIANPPNVVTAAWKTYTIT